MNTPKGSGEAWERDPLLLVHRLPHGEYSIAGKYNPASIKDQMVRAVAIVDRLCFHGVLQNPKKLLVVGAGAAGASAAFRACEHKVITALMEWSATPFERQRNSSRVVDPTEFDWPAPHWREGVMRGLPLAFERSQASALAGRWQEAYNDRIGDDTFLTIWMRTRFLSAVPLPSGKLAALFERLDEEEAGRKHWEEFDFVLSCTGPGEEVVSVGDARHASYLFWADDKLEAPNFGFARPMPEPSVLISGGGDGALQDFLRIGFPNETPREIYEWLMPEASMGTVRAEVERRVFAAEDAFRRAWVWSENATLDCQVLQQLHEAHLDAAQWAAEQCRLAGRGVLPHPGRLRNVKVVHSCSHFSVCYPFNRFLALLVNELAGGLHFTARRRLRDVKSVDPTHTCDGRAAWCWEHRHEAAFSEAVCGKEPVEINPRMQYDIVVIRHGPKAGTPKLARQILPYGLPWTKP